MMKLNLSWTLSSKQHFHPSRRWRRLCSGRPVSLRQAYADAVIRSEEEAAQEQNMRITRAAAQVAAAGGLGADGAASLDLLPAALVEAGPLPPPPAPRVRPAPAPVRLFKPTVEDNGLLVELLEVRGRSRTALYSRSQCSAFDAPVRCLPRAAAPWLGGGESHVSCVCVKYVAVAQGEADAPRREPAPRPARAHAGGGARRPWRRRGGALLHPPHLQPHPAVRRECKNSHPSFVFGLRCLLKSAPLLPMAEADTHASYTPR